MQEMYDNPQHLEDTFNQENLSEYLLQAQRSEFTELKKVIHEHSLTKPWLRILDIGIGDGRIVKHLVGIEEIRSTISKYHGIDIAQNCIDSSSQLINTLWVSDKVSVQRLDAVHISQVANTYDLIISTRFTVGNFYPFDFSIETFQPGYNMNTNDKFTHIIQEAYKLLNINWEIIIGSMYMDNESTRKHQEQSYKDFWRKVITDERDCFTASSEWWRSQRFTQQRIYDYLPTIPQEKIEFIPLDTYEYAMMVKIKK